MCEGWRYRKHSETLELVDEVSGTVSVSNQHVISIHAQNDELFIGLSLGDVVEPKVIVSFRHDVE